MRIGLMGDEIGERGGSEGDFAWCEEREIWKNGVGRGVKIPSEMCHQKIYPSVFSQKKVSALLSL